VRRTRFINQETANAKLGGGPDFGCSVPLWRRERPWPPSCNCTTNKLLYRRQRPFLWSWQSPCSLQSPALHLLSPSRSKRINLIQPRAKPLLLLLLLLLPLLLFPHPPLPSDGGIPFGSTLSSNVARGPRLSAQGHPPSSLHSSTERNQARGSRDLQCLEMSLWFSWAQSCP